MNSTQSGKSSSKHPRDRRRSPETSSLFNEEVFCIQSWYYSLLPCYTEIMSFMPAIFPTFHPHTRTQWRKWLDQHHQQAAEVWVVIYKKSTGKQTVTFLDLLDEALCYGWIDSREKGIDEETYAVRFTPRQSSTTWSEINTQRYQELAKQGLITPAGEKVGPK